MTELPGVGPRLALWWVDLLTRTAPTQLRDERRAEIWSDVFEQVHAAAVGSPGAAILGRTVRGIPSDVVWRLRIELAPERRAWHRAHPSTALATLFLVSLPVGMLADAAEARIAALRPYVDGLWLVTLLVSWVLLAFAGLAVADRLRGTARSDPAAGAPWSKRLRRGLVCVMAVSWAGSGVWRFAQVTWLNDLSTVAWVTFGFSLCGYLLAVMAEGFLTLRKLSS